MTGATFRNGTLAELREADAPAAIAAIYEDIKRATGIPQVNLIFRHLATVPDMLARTWDILGPLYVSGQISEYAGTIVRSAMPSPKAAGILAGAQWQPTKRRRCVRSCGSTTTPTGTTSSPCRALIRAGTEQRHAKPAGPASIDTKPAPGRDARPAEGAGQFARSPPAEARMSCRTKHRRLGQRACNHAMVASEIGAVPSMYLHLATLAGSHRIGAS